MEAQALSQRCLSPMVEVWLGLCKVWDLTEESPHHFWYRGAPLSLRPKYSPRPQMSFPVFQSLDLCTP